MNDCGCLTGRGHSITDPDRHSVWHGLIVQQVGPLRMVNAQTLRLARGMWNEAPPSRTLIDRRKRTGRRT